MPPAPSSCRTWSEPAWFRHLFPRHAYRPAVPARPAHRPRLASAAGSPFFATRTALLAQNGFVLTPGGAGELVDAYHQGRTPPFVTLDSLSSAFQSLCSDDLDGLENGLRHATSRA